MSKVILVLFLFLISNYSYAQTISTGYGLAYTYTKQTQKFINSENPLHSAGFVTIEYKNQYSKKLII